MSAHSNSNPRIKTLHTGPAADIAWYLAACREALPYGCEAIADHVAQCPTCITARQSRLLCLAPDLAEALERLAGLDYEITRIVLSSEDGSGQITLVADRSLAELPAVLSPKPAHPGANPSSAGGEGA